jgi:hypothetical protein
MKYTLETCISSTVCKIEQEINPLHKNLVENNISFTAAF